MAVVAAHHSRMTDIVGDVAEIDSAAVRLAGSQERWNIGSFHEPVVSFRAPELRNDLGDRGALAVHPGNGLDRDIQDE
jgi:hypothetical protein